MLFIEFAKYLDKLETTSKRLEITDILSDLIKDLSTNEAAQAIHLTLGQLKAPFESQKFNIADKMMVKAVSQAYQLDESEVQESYNTLGDLGDVIINIKTQNKSTGETIDTVYTALLDIAQIEGKGSQEKKLNKLSELLNKLDPLSAKYVTRIILGTTRLGFTALTIIDALVVYLNGNKDKQLKTDIEFKYNVHPDIGLIVAKIIDKGLAGIQDIKMEPGVPLMPQKPQRLGTTEETLEKMNGTVWAEFKLDGTRVQLHMDRKKKLHIPLTETPLFGENMEDKIFVKTFTRNLDETTHQFPDIIQAAKEYINADSVILDGEAIGYNKETGEYLPFQETIQRKRKHGIEDAVTEIPLKYLVFDILFYNGNETITKPLIERRKLLNKLIKKNDIILANDNLLTTDPSALEDYFMEAKNKKLEGLVVKNPDSEYQAGARSFSWVKLKRLEGGESTQLADTIDTVILGYYFGKGIRASFGIGGFLAGVYDKKSKEFKTLTKVGTGLKDEDWVYLKEQCNKLELKEKPSNVEVAKELVPDVWVKPTIVTELRADEISKSTQHSVGYALRFPRLIKFRTDKDALDTTSTEEIEELFRLQSK